MDFTLDQYSALCAALVAGGYANPTFAAYLREGEPPAPFVLLRHDVDSRPRHALKLAAIEQAHGLRATYFFRTVRGAFDPDAVRGVAALGHEIGYHYETLAQTRGDTTRGLRLFGSELARLRALAPVSVAAMHGSPLSRWDNRAIWQHATPADFDLLGEVYRDIDYERVVYLNDTGRTWNPTRYNLRDHTSTPPPFAPNTSAELAALLRKGEPPRLCLSTHPERWQPFGAAWVWQAAQDVVLNGVKVVLRGVRR